MTLAQYAKNSLVEDAVECCLQRITDTTTFLHKSNALLDKFPNIDWTGIRSLGDQLRHEYDTLNRETIWNIIQDDLPVLKEAAQSALSQE